MVVWLIGLFLIFIKNRKNRKPGFIRAIWGILFLYLICRAGYTYYDYKYSYVDHTRSEVRKLNMFFFTAVTLLTIAHWIFSIEYFELSIKFEMILGHVEQDFEA